jgi:tetratricopeptide (TPR) repeat protein
VLSAYASFAIDQMNDKTKALSLARDSWAAAPIAADAFPLGRVAYLSGDPKFALTLLQEAARITPADPRVNYFMAQSEFAVARAPQARDSAGRAANAREPFPEAAQAKALLPLIDFYLNQKDANVAAGASKSMLDADAKSAPALLVSGMLHELRKDYPTARTAYDQALNAYPFFLPAQRQLALLLADHLVDDVRAQQLAATLRVEMIGDPAVNRVLGKIAYRRADYKEAARLLTEAASRGTADADLLYHLGMAQYHNKDTRAKQTLDRALAMDPTAKISDEAKKAVAQLN